MNMNTEHLSTVTYVFGVCPTVIPVTVSNQLYIMILDKAFTNHHHPLLQVRTDRPNINNMHVITSDLNT